MKLAGKRAVILGGNHGIGFAVAKLLAEEGAQVAIGGRDAGRLAEAADALAGRASVVQVDVLQEDQIRRLFGEMTELDILVVTAAAHVSADLRHTSTKQMEMILGTKLYGSFWAAKYADAIMRAGGSMTFFSSAWSRVPPMGFVAEAAANAAVEGLVRALAVDLAPKGIRVNCVAPGATKTKPTIDESSPAMAKYVAPIPLQRFGRPEEIARAVLFLVTNTYVTGTTLVVDGGRLAT